MNLTVIKRQLDILQMELKRQTLSAERLLEIKEITRNIAMDIDSQSAVGSLQGMVDDIYNAKTRNGTETKHPKKRVNKVIGLLLEYVKD